MSRWTSWRVLGGALTGIALTALFVALRFGKRAVRTAKSAMRCCEACFEDDSLKGHIRRRGKRGSCQYCRARGKYVIDAAELEPFFTRFTDLYSPVDLGGNVPPDVDPLEVGEQLATLIYEQWGIFSERLVERDMHHDLLNEIFTANCMEEEILDAPAVRDLWTDRDWLHASLLDRWHELADELRHPEDHRPIAPDPVPTEEDLATATDSLGWFEDDVNRGSVTLPAGTRIFRVRLGYREKDHRTVPIPTPEMGAPPRGSVKRPGRANPVGVSYFYGAEEERTAVAEVRPHRGALATIGEGETSRDLKLIDLTARIALASPFELPGEYLSSLVESLDLFDHLNKEFAKPLRHTDDTHEYLPTQFFAEWVKDHGYDGLRYESAMSTGGHNIVLFDTAAVAVKSVRLVRTDSVEVFYSDFDDD
jgi:RES domain-containing protein